VKCGELALVGWQLGVSNKTTKTGQIGIPAMTDAPFKVDSNGGEGDTSLA
jgi:hypothetical protein